MLKQLKNTKAKKVWELFLELSKIPRCSKNEEKAIIWAKLFAEKQGWETEIDDTGNLLIRVKGKGKEWVCLQAHIDMVCVKDLDVEHDFTKDPIKVKVKDGFVFADKTTLGADDGIGVALALTMGFEKDMPNLEILLTVDEETGLTGAFGLKENWLKSKYIINLDSEDEGVFTVGSAGGLEIIGKKELFYLPNDLPAYELEIKDLPGGHSGVNIHENHRHNAIQLLANILLKIEDIYLGQIDGGEARNSIPKFAYASFASTLPKEKILNYLRETKLLYPEMNFVLKERVLDNALPKDQSIEILKTIFALPSNVLEVSNTISDLIQTSNNLGRVYIKENILFVENLLRSSNSISTEKFADKIKALLELADFRVEFKGRYPGWDPDLESKLLKTARDTYYELFNVDPKIEAIHAGLECGIIKSKYPNAEVLSVGPTIIECHTPKERVDIKSVDKFYIFLKSLLQKLSG